MIKKTSFFLLLISFLSFNLYAQDDSGFNTQGLSGGEEDNVNLYLQKVVQEDNVLKTKAETFNGSRSGVYEGSVLACPYAFERDLFVGSKGEDVRLLQILLNSDKRTLIAVNGSGSVGNETTSFGESTKAAVKKFQALFIEYVGIANGRFGPRTRTVMNSICNGQNKPSISTNIEIRQNRNIYDNIFSVQAGAATGGIVTTTKGVDSAPPRISLSANISSVKMGETFKVILNSSKEIVPITPDAIIVDGGSVKEIRKLSKTSYTATININEDAKNVLVQVEADKIEDLGGNKNENASNEISVKVKGSIIKETLSGVGEDMGASINSLLDKIIASAPTCIYNSNGLLKTISDDGKTLNTSGCAQQQTQNLTGGQGQTYDCQINGQMQKIPVTQPCPQQQNQTICTTTQNPFTGAPQQQCQQVSPQQAQQMQQAQQDRQMQDLLKSLMGQGQGGRGFGQDQNRTQQPGNIFNQPGGQPGPGGQTTQPGIADVAKASGSLKDLNEEFDTICTGEKAVKNKVRCDQLSAKIESAQADLERAIRNDIGSPTKEIDDQITSLDKKMADIKAAAATQCTDEKIKDPKVATKCTAYTEDLNRLEEEKRKLETERDKRLKNTKLAGTLSQYTDASCKFYKIGNGSVVENKDANQLYILDTDGFTTHNGKNFILKDDDADLTNKLKKGEIKKKTELEAGEYCYLGNLKKQNTLICSESNPIPATRLSATPPTPKQVYVPTTDTGVVAKGSENCKDYKEHIEQTKAQKEEQAKLDAVMKRKY